MNGRERDLRRKALESALVGGSVALGAVLGVYAYVLVGGVGLGLVAGLAVLVGLAWGYVLLLDATGERERTDRLDDALEDVETEP